MAKAAQQSKRDFLGSAGLNEPSYTYTGLGSSGYGLGNNSFGTLTVGSSLPQVTCFRANTLNNE